MRKSRVLLAGVAVAAAAVATSAFTAGNDWSPDTASPVTARPRSPVRRHQHRLRAGRQRQGTASTPSCSPRTTNLDGASGDQGLTAGQARERRCADYARPRMPGHLRTSRPSAHHLRHHRDRAIFVASTSVALTVVRSNQISERAGRPIGRPARPGTGALAMNAATRAASISAVAALVLAAVWFFWPSALGGGTTYVTTHGISMEPRLPTGDLAILRPADSYSVGDVVAYRSEASTRSSCTGSSSGTANGS